MPKSRLSHYCLVTHRALLEAIEVEAQATTPIHNLLPSSFWPSILAHLLARGLPSPLINLMGQS